MEFKATYYDLFHSLQEKYEVRNLIGENSRIIFILESPHVEELFYESPVSGLSGGTMTKALFGSENKLPLGRTVKEYLGNGNVLLDDKCHENKLSQIGIMNICRIPMQMAAYTNKKTVEKYGDFNEGIYAEFLALLEKIRTNNKETYKDEKLNILQEIILSEFKESLSTLNNKEVVLVPCGKTAQKFFDSAKISNENWITQRDIPHPSYNSWSRSKYYEKIEEIKRLINSTK